MPEQEAAAPGVCLHEIGVRQRQDGHIASGSYVPGPGRSIYLGEFLVNELWKGLKKVLNIFHVAFFLVPFQGKKKKEQTGWRKGDSYSLNLV